MTNIIFWNQKMIEFTADKEHLNSLFNNNSL